jgi:hypothetical protein
MALLVHSTDTPAQKNENNTSTKTQNIEINNKVAIAWQNIT